jgi:hypothetical protein
MAAGASSVELPATAPASPAGRGARRLAWLGVHFLAADRPS